MHWEMGSLPIPEENRTWLKARNVHGGHPSAGHSAFKKSIYNSKCVHTKRKKRVKVFKIIP